MSFNTEGIIILFALYTEEPIVDNGKSGSSPQNLKIRWLFGALNEFCKRYFDRSIFGHSTQVLVKDSSHVQRREEDPRN